jgi:hypothetical protein
MNVRRDIVASHDRSRLPEVNSMFRAALSRSLREPLLSGWQALLFASLSLALPTAVRAAVEGTVSGCEFTPYLPFVLICAIVVRWWLAGLVALGSVAVLGGICEGSRHFQLPCFESAAGIFLASSAVMIGVPVLIRAVLASMQQPKGRDGGLVFSLEKGEVWASWYGYEEPVLLGTQRSVSEMMKDFLAQEELAKRLNGN